MGPDKGNRKNNGFTWVLGVISGQRPLEHIRTQAPCCGVWDVSHPSSPASKKKGLYNRQGHKHEHRLHPYTGTQATSRHQNTHRLVLAPGLHNLAPVSPAHWTSHKGRPFELCSMLCPAAKALQLNLIELVPKIMPLAEKVAFARNYIARKVLGYQLKPYRPSIQRSARHICIHTGGHNQMHLAHQCTG